jgi:hypothetical protein
MPRLGSFKHRLLSNTSLVSIAIANYIEDVFSTYLYTGTGASQTITNSINLSANGGMVWIKARGTQIGVLGVAPHALVDSTDPTTYLNPATTDLKASLSGVNTFNTTGFGVSQNLGRSNYNGETYASWTFRKQPKFFDVVTYVGDGTIGRQISHNLASIPGCVIIKKTSTASQWPVYHTSTGLSFGLNLCTNEILGTTQYSPVTAVSSTTFTPYALAESAGSTNCNILGISYVAYIFASNSGGFGATGTDNVISCGSFTTDFTGVATVNLGYEPQWLLIKAKDATKNWVILDTMRGLNTATSDAFLYSNLTGAEATADLVDINATGFTTTTNGLTTTQNTFIYIAIRRGPMKIPTSSSSLFGSSYYTAATSQINYGFPVDAWLSLDRTGTGLAGYEWPMFTRLLGIGNALNTTQKSGWGGGWGTGYLTIDNNTGVYLPNNGAYLNKPGDTYSAYGFRRAAGFFDVVAYNGTGSLNSIIHNLTVPPEMIIVKRRDTTSPNQGWVVWCASGLSGSNYWLSLNQNRGQDVYNGYWGASGPLPSTTQFNVNTDADVNASGGTYIAYLFATCPGVSKVGSYTGTGATQTINCGFSSGSARFVIIKRTDSTGDWYVFDSSRGFTAASSPYQLLNSTAVETPGNNGCYASSSGFTVTSTASATVNVNTATYIYLAIA